MVAAGWVLLMQWLGPRPTPQHSVDRRDNDAGYWRPNIRWATKLEQTHNRSPRKQERK